VPLRGRKQLDDRRVLNGIDRVEVPDRDGLAECARALWPVRDAAYAFSQVGGGRHVRPDAAGREGEGGCGGRHRLAGVGRAQRAQRLLQPARALAGRTSARRLFETKPIAFALRDVIPGADLASVPQPGIGAAIWLHATDVQAMHDALAADGHTIVSAPVDGPFGRTFTFADPDGYHVTLHDRA